MVFFKTESKDKVMVSVFIALWVILINVVTHLFEIPGSWTVSASILFLALVQGTAKEKVTEVMVGGFFGMLCGLAVLVLAPVLDPLVGHHLSVLIPVAIIIFAIIVGHNYAPYICNDVAFGYLILSTLAGGSYKLNAGTYLLVFVIGGLIVTIGTVYLKRALVKHFVKEEAK